MTAEAVPSKQQETLARSSSYISCAKISLPLTHRKH